MRTSVKMYELSIKQMIINLIECQLKFWIVRLHEHILYGFGGVETLCNVPVSVDHEQEDRHIREVEDALSEHLLHPPLQPHASPDGLDDAVGHWLLDVLRTQSIRWQRCLVVLQKLGVEILLIMF